jgi:hypothetical protein
VQSFEKWHEKIIQPIIDEMNGNGDGKGKWIFKLLNFKILFEVKLKIASHENNFSI